MATEIQILVDFLNNQVAELMQQGAYPQGLRLAIQAVEMGQQHLGGNHLS